ncbi:hypothetical protein GCM10012284_32640 [Mangrovihabitans endophyticus]|uniref:Uncharacterized protein n=1 Tax=Mangrovihabitans endophyticus TaxID=1751298 RepID=A0A8J3FP21_9ACTN|nr:hypothetical protein GCM10012284_32640 [Mangrovihabitans endophyticus]
MAKMASMNPSGSPPSSPWDNGQSSTVSIQVLRTVQVAALGEPISGDDADEGALANLTHSADQHDSCVAQRGVHLRCGAARYQV